MSRVHFRAWRYNGTIIEVLHNGEWRVYDTTDIEGARAELVSDGIRQLPDANTARVTRYPSRIEYRTASGVYGEFQFSLHSVQTDEFALQLGKVMRTIMADLPDEVVIRYENWED